MDAPPNTHRQSGFAALAESRIYGKSNSIFIITGRSKKQLENEVRPIIEQFLQERGLELSPEKTCVTHIEQGFDFQEHIREGGNADLAKTVGMGQTQTSREIVAMGGP